jgi:multidrug resistance efflux pump
MIDAAKANVVSAQAELARAQPNYERYKKMVATNVVGKSDYDQVEATLRKAEAEVSRTQAALTAEQGQLVVDLADREQADAQLAQAQAALTAAKNDLDNTVIKAPVDGVVGNKGVQTGQYVKVGTQLMAVVPLPQVYVVANFKETQLENMRQGQPVEIAVDAYPNHKLIGTVESFAPASGACSACCRRRTPPATSPRSCSACPCASPCRRRMRSPACCGRVCPSKSASIRAPAAPARRWPVPSSARPRRRRPATRPPVVPIFCRLISDG